MPTMPLTQPSPPKSGFRRHMCAIVCAVFTLALTFGFAVKAYADPSETGPCSITIDDPITVPAVAYQVFDVVSVSSDGSVNEIAMGSGFGGEARANAFLAALKADSSGYWSSCARPMDYALVIAENSDAAHLFAKMVIDYMDTDMGYSFDDIQTPLASNLPVGMYVVTSSHGAYTTMSEAEREGCSFMYPALVTVSTVEPNAHIDPKTHAPTVRKYVYNDDINHWDTSATYDTYETYQYKIVSTLGDEANLFAGNLMHLRFEDWADPGITIDMDSVRVTIDGEDVTHMFHIFLESDDMNPPCHDDIFRTPSNRMVDAASFCNHLVVSTYYYDGNPSEYDGIIIPNGDSEIVITYEAHLNAACIVGHSDQHAVDGTCYGNINAVNLYYEADPWSTSQNVIWSHTPYSEVSTFTTGVRVWKYDLDNSNTLSGAGFIIKNPDTNKFAIMGYYDNFNEDRRDDYATDGIPTYEQVMAGTSLTVNGGFIVGWTSDVAQASVVMISGFSDIANIYGLDPQNYLMYEVVAPDGYRLPDSALSDDTTRLTTNVGGVTRSYAAFEFGISNTEFIQGIPTDLSRFPISAWSYDPVADYLSQAFYPSDSPHQMELNVSNEKSPILPTTGILGITIPVVLGAGVAVFASARLAKRAKDNANAETANGIG